MVIIQFTSFYVRNGNGPPALIVQMMIKPSELFQMPVSVHLLPCTQILGLNFTIRTILFLRPLLVVYRLPIMLFILVNWIKTAVGNSLTPLIVQLAIVFRKLLSIKMVLST